MFPWASFRRAKGGVKAHVLLDHDDYMPSYVLITEARRSDVKMADAFPRPDNSRFTALDQIRKSNVQQLEVAWTYFNGSSGMNPLVVDGVMYVYGRNNSLIALDASTGKEIWIHTGLSSIATLGINHWESKDRKDRRLIFQINHFLEEIDARTGKSILSFGKNGLVEMREGLDRVPEEVARIKSDAPGRVFENLIIEGSSTGENFLAPPGHIRGISARST